MLSNTSKTSRRREHFQTHSRKSITLIPKPDENTISELIASYCNPDIMKSCTGEIAVEIEERKDSNNIKEIKWV